jgi:hypothetical protein
MICPGQGRFPNPGAAFNGLFNTWVRITCVSVGAYDVQGGGFQEGEGAIAPISKIQIPDCSALVLPRRHLEFVIGYLGRFRILDTGNPQHLSTIQGDGKEPS